MGRRARETEAKCCPKHRFMAPDCVCGADIYKKIFGPTLDESLFVLVLAILELMDLWKRTADDEECSEEGIEEWDDFTETSASPPVGCQESCCKNDASKPGRRKSKSRYCV